MTRLSPFALRHRLPGAAAAIAAVAAFLGASAPALAADPPFGAETVSISARGQDVRDFVTDFFGEAGLRSKVSNNVRGQVQGVFRDPPALVWATIARAYNLTAYWDGTIVRIYSNEEVTSRSIPAFAPDRLVTEVGRLGISDSVNTVRSGDGLVLATGVPEYLEQVEALADSMRSQWAASQQQAETPAVTQLAAATPAAAVPTVASPLLRAPLARATVRSEILRSAGGRDPFEVRIFFLTYRDAADREVRSADRLTVIPGVATLLQEQMGDGRQVGSVTSSAANEYDITGARSVSGSRSSRSRADRDFFPDDRDEPATFEPELNGPRISADPTVNAVIVRDVPEMMEVYENMIANLDVEPLMVETQVTILELNVTRLERLGFGFGFGLDGLGALFGNGVNFNSGGLTGGYLSGSGALFLARIEALKERGALRVVTRQVLSTANNQVASFDISQQQLVRLLGEREVDAVAINYGLGLRVRPSAIEDGGEMRIRLQLELEDTGVSGQEVDGVPVTGGAQLATTAIVRQGESVLLGGMTSTRTSDRRRRTPVLGDIPGLGELFNSRRRGTDRVERLFLLTPRVSNLGQSQYAAEQRETYSLEQLRGEEPLPGQPL